MTSDLGDRPDATVAVRGGSWLRRSVRRPVAADSPVTTVEMAYERMLINAEQARDVAENRVECAKAAIDARVGHTRQRHRWAGLTQDEMLAAFADALLEVRSALSREAK